MLFQHELLTVMSSPVARSCHKLFNVQVKPIRQSFRQYRARKESSAFRRRLSSGCGFQFRFDRYFTPLRSKTINRRTSDVEFQGRFLLPVPGQVIITDTVVSHQSPTLTLSRHPWGNGIRRGEISGPLSSLLQPVQKEAFFCCRPDVFQRRIVMRAKYGHKARPWMQIAAHHAWPRNERGEITSGDAQYPVLAQRSAASNADAGRWWYLKRHRSSNDAR